MGWGVSLLGFDAVLGALDDIQVQLGDDAVYVVGTNVSYAVYQELGTSRMEAQSFLFPAAREAERNLSSLVAKATGMDDAVKRVALSIERKAKENAPVDTGNLRASIRTERIR